MELLMNTTIAGTVTALAILLIKLILKDKLTPKWHVAIWLILAVRLLVPVLPESDVSVFNAIPRVEHTGIVQSDGDVDVRDVRNGQNARKEAAYTSQEEPVFRSGFALQTPATITMGDGSFTVKKRSADWIVFGWKAGMAAMAIALIATGAVFGRRVRKLPLCRDPELLALFENCKKEAGVKSGRIQLRMGGDTPMLAGLRKPVILIPEGYTYEELRHVLLHELCHYRHKDIWINVLCCFLLSVYWFNPVLWLCFFIIRRDLEMLCDCRTVEITGERKSYASVLLKTALKRNQFLPAATAMQNGEKEVAKRIRSLAYFRRPKLWISVAAVIAILAVAVLCLTNGTFSRTVILDAGDGYFLKIPKSWEAGAEQQVSDDPETLVTTIFHDKEGNAFGGIERLGVDLEPYLDPSAPPWQQGASSEKIDYMTVKLPEPNHSREVSRTVIEDLTPVPTIIVELEKDSETAAQEAERNASGDMTPSKKIRETHIYLWPDSPSAFLFPDSRAPYVYDLWADAGAIPQADLVKIAKTFQKEERPGTYKPAADFSGGWEKTAKGLLEEYFENYADAQLTRASDISGYSIQSLKPLKDGDGFWRVIYPDSAVFQINYTLDIAYPDQYKFTGGDFEIGEGKRTKIFKDELAVFSLNGEGKAVFLGFISASYADGLGQSSTVISLINHGEMKERAAALIKAKTPYVGDNSKVRHLVDLMPMAEYFSGMELQTREEPYGITVNYDLTEMGNKIFEGGEERAPTDSRGWDVNPYIHAQLYQNAAMLLSLVDNAGTVALNVKGISETGASYTYAYLLDRETLNKKFVQDARWSAGSVESYCDFLNALETSQVFPDENAVYRIN